MPVVMQCATCEFWERKGLGYGTCHYPVIADDEVKGQQGPMTIAEHWCQFYSRAYDRDDT